jgi:hypothetical protein
MACAKTLCFPSLSKTPRAISLVLDTPRKISIWPHQFAHRGAHSGCDPDCGASAVPACGLANRSRAASGIMSAGITTGARGASAGLGQASAGNARKLPRPRKPGLKSKSRGLETSARAAVERREASAPEASGSCKRIARGARRARGADRWRHLFVWRGPFDLRLPALRLPFYLEAKQQWLSFLLQNSGAQRAARTRSLVLSAPAQRGRGTTGARAASEPWWRGRRTRSFVVVAEDTLRRKKRTNENVWRSPKRLRRLESRAPSTTLRALRAFSGGPPPPLRGGGRVTPPPASRRRRR